MNKKYKIESIFFDCNLRNPVSYEALVEVTYPVKEETSAGLLSLVVLTLFSSPLPSPFYSLHLFLFSLFF